MDQNTSSAYLDKCTKKLRNSLIGSFLLILAVASVFLAQTYAYFWDTNTVMENKIQTGKLDVELLEVQNTGDEILFGTEPVSFIPGATVRKAVKVSNTGDVPVYVRIKIEKNITDLENNLPDGWEALISCEFNIDDESTANSTEGLWIYRDGYYYYYSKLDPHTITPSLFDKIVFSTLMGNEFANKELEFKVICQSVQANGNSSSPLTAWGWPAED